MRKIFSLSQYFLLYVALLFSFKSFAEEITLTAPVSKTSGTINAASSSVANIQIINETTITMSNSSRGDGINSSGSESSITNNNQISVQAFGTLLNNRGGDGIDVSGSESLIENAVGAGITVGTTLITSRAGYAINVSGIGSSINNLGQISTGLGALGGINLNAASVSLSNQASGIISHAGITSNAITVNSTNASIDNQGAISVVGIAAHGIRNNSSGLNIVNTGYILTQDSIPFIRDIDQNTFGAFAIRNTNSISTLVNAQGGDASQNNRIALTYNGSLPSQYEVIVTDPTHYGQLFARNVGGGLMTYAINDQTDLRKGTYSSVLVGVNSENLTNTIGGYKGFAFRLVNNGDPDVNSLVWDLIVTGAYTADTQSSMRYQASQLRSAFNTQTVAANFALNYDCNVFDAKSACISAGGRYTTIDNPGINNSAAVVTLGYKVNPNIRIGGYLDQSINISNPTGINISNNTPLMGAYAVWNKEQSGLGYQVRLANTYQDKDVTSTRTVFNTSEAGSGKSSLQSQSYLAELSYAFQYEDKTLVRPYAGLRYTHLKQKGYTEDTIDTVTDPLTVAALRDKGITALLGVKINRSLTDKATLTAQLGFEQDVHHNVGQYSATDLNGIDLTAITFNSNIKRTRPVASIGAFYDISKTQRVSATINYQQLPFQSTGSATAYVNFMIGF
jgi:hypothetical protein